MCLYPKLRLNKKYTSTKKNGGVIPAITDSRTMYVPYGCGKCIECRKQKARDWQVRLLEEIRDKPNGKFITLTFSNEKYRELCETIWEKIPDLKGYALDNQVVTLAVKLFRERHRKKYKTSGRRWLVSELGHEGTENVHLHGIIWLEHGSTLDDIETLWGYGHVWKGKKVKGHLVNYVNETTVGYITKYVSKQDEIHKHYKPVVLCSPGIGGSYLKRWDSKKNEFNGDKTVETYKTRTGHNIRLPIYWRNKLYSDAEKEKLWLNKLDKEIRYIRGEKFDISKDFNGYFSALKWHRERNLELGYGTDDIDYDEKRYEEQIRVIKQMTRISKAKK